MKKKKASLGQGLKVRALSTHGSASGDSRKRVGIRLSKNIKAKMNNHMLAHNYTKKETSRWIEEAIKEFIKHPYWMQMAIQSQISDYQSQGQARTILIEKELWEDLWKKSLEMALSACEKEEPVFLSPSLSSLIKAAILWRIDQ